MSVLSGEFRVVVRFPFVTETAVSPDGQTLAFTSTADGSVNTVPMAGGQAVQRFRDPDLWGQGLEWTSDGR